MAPVDVWAETAAEFISNVRARVSGWYSSESRMYSVMIGEKITWRSVVRVHLILVCLLVAIGAAEQNLLVAGASMASTGWLVYRLNVDEKNQCQDTQSRKGGKR